MTIGLIPSVARRGGSSNGRDTFGQYINKDRMLGEHRRALEIPGNGRHEALSLSFLSSSFQSRQEKLCTESPWINGLLDGVRTRLNSRKSLRKSAASGGSKLRVSETSELHQWGRVIHFMTTISNLGQATYLITAIPKIVMRLLQYRQVHCTLVLWRMKASE